MKAAPTPVVHLELHTGDLRRAREFYTELCGWRSERIDTRSGSWDGGCSASRIVRPDNLEPEQSLCLLDPTLKITHGVHLVEIDTDGHQRLGDL